MVHMSFYSGGQNKERENQVVHQKHRMKTQLYGLITMLREDGELKV